MKSKLNRIAIIFAIVFIIIFMMRFDSLETIDIVAYSLVVFGFLVMGVAPLFNKEK